MVNEFNAVGTAVSGPVVAFVVEIILRLTPASFDRKRFALPIAAIISLGLSILEAVTYSHLAIWAAIVRGLTVAMASAGAYEVLNNYSNKEVDTDA